MCTLLYHIFDQDFLREISFSSVYCRRLIISSYDPTSEELINISINCSWFLQIYSIIADDVGVDSKTRPIIYFFIYFCGFEKINSTVEMLQMNTICLIMYRQLESRDRVEYYTLIVDLALERNGIVDIKFTMGNKQNERVRSLLVVN